MLLPVRAWRVLRLQLASEKQDSPAGPASRRSPRFSPSGEGVADDLGVGLFRRVFSYGRAVAKIVCANFIWCDTLVQYAACSSLAFCLLLLAREGERGR